MKTNLLTDWLTIGTSGPTVDGRVIKPEWLTDAAETYDPEEYTAVINAEHIKYYGNYGSVRELKTVEDKKGRTALQARIRPNIHYLSQNVYDQRLFTSMELQHNFAKTGKTYLTGLAATDQPASLGTSENHFSKEDNEKVFRGGATEISSNDFSIKKEEKESLGATVKKALTEFFKKDNKEEIEDYEMTKEEVKALMDGQTKLNTTMENLAGAVTKFTENFKSNEQHGKQDASDGKNAEDGKGKNNDEDAGKTDATVSDENIQKMNASIDKVVSTVEDLTTKLDNAINGKFGKNTDGQGAAGDSSVKFV